MIKNSLAFSLICSLLVLSGFRARGETLIQCSDCRQHSDRSRSGFELAIGIPDRENISKTADSQPGPLPEDLDRLVGAVGGTWRLKLGSENSSWIEPSLGVTAAPAYDSEAGRVVEIRVTLDRTELTPIEIIYALINTLDAKPILAKYRATNGASKLEVFCECAANHLVK